MGDILKHRPECQSCFNEIMNDETIPHEKKDFSLAKLQEEETYYITVKTPFIERAVPFPLCKKCFGNAMKNLNFTKGQWDYSNNPRPKGQGI